jgi:nucleoside-diphosphate-sugar epimerase
MTRAKRILLIGGGGPTGPLIVNGLIAEGHEVAVMNTGRHPVEFDAPVECIIADPNFLEPIETAVAGRSFDTVIAQYGRLRYVAQALIGHVEHLIGISSTFYPNWIDPPATVRPTSESGVARDWSVTYLDEGGAMPETAPLDPVGKFGERVVDTDKALQRAHSQGDFVGTILRYPPRSGASSGVCSTDANASSFPKAASCCTALSMSRTPRALFSRRCETDRLPAAGFSTAPTTSPSHIANGSG